MNDKRTRRYSLRASLLATVLLVATSTAATEYWEYVVQPGDNLWDLSEEYLTSMRYWRKLQALNKVSEPLLLPPGRRLKIPLEWLHIEPSGAKVFELRGEPQVRLSKTGAVAPLTLGLELGTGDIVVTGPDDSVTLEFAGGSRLLLQSESELELKALERYGRRGSPASRLGLSKGNADTKAERPKPGGGRFEIHTPAAISAVRGTDFRVGVEDGGRLARTETIEGVVEVSGSGRKARLPAGFGTLAEVGKGPQKPVALLPSPDLSALPSEVRRIPAAFTVPPLPGASAYRWQLSDRDDFATLLRDRVTSNTTGSFFDLADGPYFLRVRAIAANGIQGRDAVHAWRLDAHPEPPVLIEPRQGGSVYGDSPSFQWAAPESARSFVFQLARDEEFLSPVVERPSQSGSRLTLSEPVEPGSYFWRVASRDASGKEGPFSDPQGFLLKPVPEAPTPEADDADKKQLVLRWRSGPPGQSYQLQLARDTAFENLVIDKRVAGSEVALPRPASGVYYMRIKSIDADGYQGPFGEVHKLDVSPATYWPFAIFGVAVLLILL